MNLRAIFHQPSNERFLVPSSISTGASDGLEVFQS